MMTEYKRVPTDTSKQGHPNPVVAKSVGLAAIVPDIIAMEKRGQQEIVDSHVLPTRMLHGASAERLEALGFVLGDVVAADPIFRVAKLPDGWKREASDHDMWSYIVDERGIRRVSMFYKAAYYDRHAHLQIVDVGADLAGHVIYSDTPPTVESLAVLDALTPDELAAFTATLRKRAEDMAQSSYAPDALQLANVEAATAILNARAARET